MCQLLLHFTKAWENQNMSCSKMINDLTLISFDSHSLLFSVPKFHPHTEKKPSDSLEGKSTRIICNWYLYKTNILTQGTEIPLSMFIFITSCGVHNHWPVSQFICQNHFTYTATCPSAISSNLYFRTLTCSGTLSPFVQRPPTRCPSCSQTVEPQTVIGSWTDMVVIPLSWSTRMPMLCTLNSTGRFVYDRYQAFVPYNISTVKPRFKTTPKLRPLHY